MNATEVAAPAPGEATAPGGRSVFGTVFKACESGIVLALIVLVAFTATQNSRFLSGQSIRDILLGTAILAVLAVGQAIVMITRRAGERRGVRRARRRTRRVKAHVQLPSGLLANLTELTVSMWVRLDAIAAFGAGVRPEVQRELVAVPDSPHRQRDRAVRDEAGRDGGGGLRRRRGRPAGMRVYFDGQLTGENPTGHEPAPAECHPAELPGALAERRAPVPDRCGGRLPPVRAASPAQDVRGLAGR